jgi:hypothetical protein
MAAATLPPRGAYWQLTTLLKTLQAGKDSRKLDQRTRHAAGLR